MATGTIGHYRAWTAKRRGGSYGSWRGEDLLIARRASDPVGPAWPTARLELNLPGVADHCWNWRDYIAPDDLVAIVSDDHYTEGQRCMFVGYIADVQWSFAANERCIVTAVGPAFRLVTGSAYQVYGSYWSDKAGTVRHFSALPCEFNPGGRPNRAAAVDSGEYYFTSVHDPTAVYWTAVTAVEYLCARYNSGETYMDNPSFFSSDRDASPAVAVSVEGLSLWAALAKVASHGGYDIGGEITLAGGNNLSVAIDVIRRGAGSEVILDHQAPGAGGALPVIDTDKTNLFATRAAESVTSCRTSPIVLGGQDLYEITVELEQVWCGASLEIPDGGSVVAPGQEQANADNPWVQRYCTAGASFTQYADVGRLWDANADGLYSAVSYLIGITVPDMAALAGQTAGTWPQMQFPPIRLLSRLGATSHSAGKQSFAEFSVDDGSHWYPLAGYRVLRDRLGLYISAGNLAGIFPDGGSAGVDDIFTTMVGYPANVRIRLTCTVAGPDRQVAHPSPMPDAGTAFHTGEIFDRGPLGQVRTRSAGSALAGGGIDADEQAAGTELAVAATNLQRLNQDRKIEAQMIIETIEAPADVPLGGRVERIGGINVRLGVNAGSASRYPRIVRRTWDFDKSRTLLALDTDRQTPVV